MSRHAERSPQPETSGTSAYERHKEQSAKRQREQSAAGREIGPLPEVVSPERRESCRADFCLFAKTYFPAIYSLEFSPDHIQVIAQIQRAVTEGGLFALAMGRGVAAGRGGIQEMSKGRLTR